MTRLAHYRLVRAENRSHRHSHPNQVGGDVKDTVYQLRESPFLGDFQSGWE